MTTGLMARLVRARALKAFKTTFRVGLFGQNGDLSEASLADQA